MTAAATSRPRSNLLRPRVSRVRIVQLLGLAGFLTLWEVLGSQQAYLWSTPTRVAKDFVVLFTERNGLTLVFNTVSVLVVGLAISLTAGILIGTLLGRFRTVGVMFDPYFAAFYAVPRVAFVPLMVVWFGIGQEFVVAAVIAAVTIMIVFATAAGVRETRRVYTEIATSLRITGWDFFAKVLVPGSIPYIATGTRLGVQRGLVAVIVSEFLIGLPGIGRMLRESRTEMLTDRMYSTAIVAMLVGVGLIMVTGVIERRFSRWRPQAF